MWNSFVEKNVIRTSLVVLLASTLVYSGASFFIYSITIHSYGTIEYIGDIEDRRQEIVNTIAQMSPPTPGQFVADYKGGIWIARILVNGDINGANEWLTKSTIYDTDYHDNSAIAALDVVALYWFLENRGQLSAEAKSHCEQMFGEWPSLGFGTGSENLNINYYVALYLAAQAIGDTTNLFKQESNIKNWVVNRAKYGYEEHNSPSYTQWSVAPFYVLAEFADDPTIRLTSQMAIDFQALDYAIISLDHRRGGPQKRFYKDLQRRDQSQAGDLLSNFGYLYFGIGESFSTVTHAQESIYPAFAGYRPADLILDIGADENGRGSYEFKGQRPSPCSNMYYYVTPEYVLACTQLSVQAGGSPGMMYHPWDLSFKTSPQTVLYSDKSYMQYKNVIIFDSGGLYYSPDLTKETDGSWVFIKSGGTYVAQRLDLLGTASIMEVCLASDFSSFSDFKTAIKNNPLVVSETKITYTNTIGDQIEFQTDAPHSTKVNGQPFALAGYKLFESPLVNSEYGNGYIHVEKGGKYYVLDFNML